MARGNEGNTPRSKQEDERSVGTERAKPRTWCQKVRSRDKGVSCYPTGGQLPENQTEINAEDQGAFLRIQVGICSFLVTKCLEKKNRSFLAELLCYNSLGHVTCTGV